MKITQLLVLLLSFGRPIIAYVQLVERQPQGVWPDWNLGEAFWKSLTILGGAGAGIVNLFQDPQDSDSAKTIPPPDTGTESDRQTVPDTPKASPSPATSSPSEPVYKININNDQSTTPDPDTKLPAVFPSLDEKCGLLNINDANCGKIADQLVFASSCIGINPNQIVSAEAMAQNQAIRETLDVMNSQNMQAGMGGRGLRISKSDICDVFFWALPLTQDQIAQIEKKPGVRMVRPNRELPMEDIPDDSDMEDSDPADIPVLSAPGSQLKERDQVVVDPLAWEDLRFISTRQNMELSSAYFYYKKAGDEVTVIAVDSGVSILNDEFRTVSGESPFLDERIYAMDTSELPDDEDNLGTCRTSKIVGRTVGVARKAKVMLAKVSPNLSSIIDVLVQIANYLNNKNFLGKNVLGYHVMSIMIQWDNQDPDETALFEEMLSLLTVHFQLVVVVPTGMDRTSQNSDVNMWPATAASRYNLIVVGAVQVKTGRTYPFSRGGPFLTVNAPGVVRCASNRAGRSYSRRANTDVAAATVAGLVAYFLSLDDIGPALRRDPGQIPLRVKYYISKVAAYKRVDDDFPAIWNLLGA